MKEHNVQQWEDFPFKVFLAVVLVIVVYRVFGLPFPGFSRPGIIESYHYEGATLYIRLGDGHDYQANACRGQIMHGNWGEFTAVPWGPGGSMIIYCKIEGSVLNGPLPN